MITAKKPRAPKGGHQLAAPLPQGTTLTDFKKQNWVVGKPVGSGGFGLIYLGNVYFSLCQMVQLELWSHFPIIINNTVC